VRGNQRYFLLDLHFTTIRTIGTFLRGNMVTAAEVLLADKTLKSRGAASCEEILLEVSTVLNREGVV